MCTDRCINFINTNFFDRIGYPKFKVMKVLKNFITFIFLTVMIQTLKIPQGFVAVCLKKDIK